MDIAPSPTNGLILRTVAELINIVEVRPAGRQWLRYFRDLRVSCFSGLGEYTTHHLDEEEMEIFPMSQQVMSAEDLDTLGKLFVEAKNKLLGIKLRNKDLYFNSGSEMNGQVFRHPFKSAFHR